MKVLIYVSLFVLLQSCSVHKQDKEVVKRVVILGNSIVAHDPAPAIGWNHDWGMAASCRDCDFVHILKDSILKVSPMTKVEWASISVFEREYKTYKTDQLAHLRDADVLIIKISENVVYEQGMEDEFLKKFHDLVVSLTPSNKTKVVISEGFWPTPVNGILQDYAKKNGFLQVKLADLFVTDKRNAAIGLFENEGVANHPSDFGMKNIADRMWNVISVIFK